MPDGPVFDCPRCLEGVQTRAADQCEPNLWLECTNCGKDFTVNIAMSARTSHSEALE